MKTTEKKARFDTRLSLEQKNFFERAARLGGYRSLTDFIILSAQEKAYEIIAKREQVIASDKDKKVFFETLMNPPQPNIELNEAAENYQQAIDEISD